MLRCVGELDEPVVRRECNHLRRVKSDFVSLRESIVIGHQKTVFEIGTDRMRDHPFPQKPFQLSVATIFITILIVFANSGYSPYAYNHSLPCIFGKWHFFRVEENERFLGLHMVPEGIKELLLVAAIMKPVGDVVVWLVRLGYVF